MEKNLQHNSQGVPGKEFIAEIKDIIQAQSTKNKEDYLKARAPPNQRLVLAFGIDNAFTTTDKNRHSEFKNEARKKVDVDDQAWIGMRKDAERFADARLEYHYRAGNKLVLAELVQFLTLKMSIMFLFNPGNDTFDGYESTMAMTIIAQEINRIWQNSKNPSFTGIESEGWAAQLKFHQALDIVTEGSPHPLDPLIPKQNPLNWILPSYETLWRVVLRLTLEIRFHGAPPEDQDAWRESLRQFADGPCQDTMRAKSPINDVSVHNLVREALRLYPPTRRIHRQREGGKVFKADIEACHRNKLIASETPEQFLPVRWKDVKEGKEGRAAEEALGFFPFGCLPYACPAGSESSFAFRMIALMTWLVSEVCIGDKWELDKETRLEKRGTAFKSERDDYMDLSLTLKEE